MPFEEARDELLSDMRAREGERRYYDMRETLGDESFAHPDDLNYIAELLDLDIREQAGVSRESGEGIASHSRVRRDAFSELVLSDRLNSDPIELDGDRVVVIRVLEHRPSEQRPLEEVADDIRERLKGEKALAQAEERAEALLAELRDGVAPDALSDNGSYQVEGPRALSRDDSDVDSRVREQLFRMPRPDNGSVVEQVRRGDGDLALLVLHSVDSRMLADLGPDELRQRKAGFAQEVARSEFNFYVREMRRNAEVEVLVDTDDEEEVFGR
jgi:peptidyl-prolyl cis-trans isomerase D